MGTYTTCLEYRRRGQLALRFTSSSISPAAWLGKGIIILADFNWRVRVGELVAFELLLPVLHPVFGIPCIPAATLKEQHRAWETAKVIMPRLRLIGMLDQKVAQTARVEFLDAFPTKPCLSVDVAAPQWHWQNNKVLYKQNLTPFWYGTSGCSSGYVRQLGK